MPLGLGGRRSLIALTVVTLVLVLVGSAAITGAIGSAEEPSGDDVLDRLEQRYESAQTLTSVTTVTVENDSESLTATVEFAAASDNRSRTIVTRNDREYRMGTNGAVVWAVGPNHSAVWPIEALGAETDGAAAPGAPAEEMMPGEHGDHLSAQGTPTMNASNVSATLVGTPTVDGVSTYEVELSHPDAEVTTSLWVSQDDYRLVRAVATDGTNRTVVSVESTDFNVSIHDSTFDPPSDRIAVSSVDQYDDFEAAQSATDLPLPGLDASFVEATVTVRQDETFVGQRYVREDRNVSIVSTTADDRFDRLTDNASTTTLEGQTVAVTTAEDRAVATWTEDGVTTVVIAEGSSERAVAIAEELLA